MKKALKWIWGIALTALVGYLAADRAGLLENSHETENQDEIEKIREAQARKQIEARTRQVTEADSFCDAAEMAVNSVVYVKVVTKSPYQSHSSLLDLLFDDTVLLLDIADKTGIGFLDGFPMLFHPQVLDAFIHCVRFWFCVRISLQVHAGAFSAYPTSSDRRSRCHALRRQAGTRS